jgi:hypothetical protein
MEKKFTTSASPLRAARRGLQKMRSVVSPSGVTKAMNSGFSLQVACFVYSLPIIYPRWRKKPWLTWNVMVYETLSLSRATPRIASAPRSWAGRAGY